MARKKAYPGKAEGCQLLESWLARKAEDGSRAFYERGMAEHPNLMPCPQHNGWWIYREACNFCPYGRHA
jgi:hypothetical protein